MYKTKCHRKQCFCYLPSMTRLYQKTICSQLVPFSACNFPASPTSHCHTSVPGPLSISSSYSQPPGGIFFPKQSGPGGLTLCSFLALCPSAPPDSYYAHLWINPLCTSQNYFFLMFIYFEKERDHKQGRDKERGRERIPSRFHTQHRAQLGA